MQTRIGDIHAGLPDAKDDIQLNEWQFKESYVVPPKLHIGNLINGNIYYIIGNKGLGKTAAMRYLALMLRKDNNRTVTSFLLFEQDYTHQGKTGMESTAAQSIVTYDMESGQSLDVMDFTLVWRWHLYLRMVELNAEGNIFVQEKNWKKFSKFVLGISKCEPKVTVSGGVEIQLPENLPFFNFIKPRISIELHDIGRRDYSFEEAMAEADACFVKLQRRDTPCYFFIDELDVHYGDERNYIRDLRLVHDLAVEVKRMNLLIHELQWTGIIKLFCTLRPEVIRAIDNHLPVKNLAREIEGFSMPLSWVSETEETYTSPIMKLFLKRIEKAEEANGEAGGSDAARYNRWFPERIDGMEPSDYIRSITWSRPRDIVRLLRAAQSARGTDQAFTKYVFQALRREYSNGSLDEIKDELEASYPAPEIQKLMLCFQDLPERFTLADFQEGIDDVYGQDGEKPDAVAILSDLYRVGVIGQVTGNRIRWAYKGDSDFRNRNSQVNIVHKGLIHALCVAPEKRIEDEREEEERQKREEEERLEAERKKRERTVKNPQNSPPRQQDGKSVPEGKGKKNKRIVGVVVVIVLLFAGVSILLSGIPEPEIEVGEICRFGRYPQENDEAEPIEWIVLDKNGEDILLLSKYALDAKCYNEIRESITWEECSLRTWLNNDFYQEAFSDAEKNRIKTAEVSAVRNPTYTSVNPGNDTLDKVFLLNIQDYKLYFNDKESAICKPTEYAIGHGVSSNSTGAGCWWWLRSPGYFSNYAEVMDPSGFLDGHGRLVDSGSVGVRPALWVNL